MGERAWARGVSKVFGSTWAVRGVNITVGDGECVALEGPNGSGKSTLLGMLGMMIRPTTGTVGIGDGEFRPDGGETTLEDALERRRHLGWVSHEGWTYGDLSARGNVELVARLHGLDERAAWSQSEARFEMAEFAERPVRTCSRGQRQRIALACALVHAPLVLLLDEPTTGLDARATERLVTTLEEEVRRGASVVVVTHEAVQLERVITRRVRMSRGRLVADSDAG